MLYTSFLSRTTSSSRPWMTTEPWTQKWRNNCHKTNSYKQTSKQKLTNSLLFLQNLQTIWVFGCPHSHSKDQTIPRYKSPRMKLSQNTHSPEEKKQQHFSMHKLFMSAWRSKFLKSIKVWIKSGIGPKPKPTLTLPPTENWTQNTWTPKKAKTCYPTWSKFTGQHKIVYPRELATQLLDPVLCLYYWVGNKDFLFLCCREELESFLM